MKERVFRCLLLALLACAQVGCLSFGPRTLKVDQVDYARALGEAKKREILAMIVGLRYADSPALLTVSQVISGYTFTASASPFSESVPPGPVAGFTGIASYSDHPTFTFTPTTGESYAKSYIHPLAASLLLPLAGGGIPIDLLLRIAVQSVGNLNNATMLGGPNSGGTPGFFELLGALRRLQMSGDMALQLTPDGGVSLALGLMRAEESTANTADRTRVLTLLQLPSGTDPYPIIGATGRPSERTIRIVTRSILAILTDLGAEIDLPEADIARGATKPSVPLVGGETRPVVIVHASKSIHGSIYASINYRASHFWVDDDDFDSKYALSVVQDLMALAEETDTSHAPVVTVSAH